MKTHQGSRVGSGETFGNHRNHCACRGRSRPVITLKAPRTHQGSRVGSGETQVVRGRCAGAGTHTVRRCVLSTLGLRGGE